MLSRFPKSSAAVWLDLVNATDAERTEAEAAFGSVLPTREALSEIESSSRMRVRDGVLYLSVPSAAPHTPGARPGSPIGFVLSHERLVTVRYGSLPSFDAVTKALEADPASSGLEVFLRLCEEIVDRLADALEHLAADLTPLSEAAFHVEDVQGRRAVRSNKLLRLQLRSLGRHGDRLSEIRDTLVGLERITAFAGHNIEADASIKQRLASLAQDLASLADYDDQLFNKVQFLLDALVGLIGIAQNDIFKVLTIVSIVGIPPTLVASLYGMNFKNMPEYGWAFGYQYGLAMIVISAAVPLVWFKIKGWF
ncbi:MAG TPA: magnesium transporter CorA family protein [Caulobacteraceae bacterium]|jgi:magnesium transporter